MKPENNDVSTMQKEPYEAPELMIHGDVEELTQFNAGGPTDGDTGINSQGLF